MDFQWGDSWISNIDKDIIASLEGVYYSPVKVSQICHSRNPVPKAFGIREVGNPSEKERKIPGKPE